MFERIKEFFRKGRRTVVAFDTVKVDKVIKRLHIQPVGNGYIDMICPKENIAAFVNEMDALGVRIYGFTWWCHVTDDHKPCGLGGPHDKYGDGWYSEISVLGDVVAVESNDDVRRFFLETYPESKEYKPCRVPGFWLVPCERFSLFIEKDRDGNTVFFEKNRSDDTN